MDRDGVNNPSERFESNRSTVSARLRAVPSETHRKRRVFRQAFIGFAIVVFLLYCWASVAYQNQVDVPAYKTAQVNLLGAKTREQWDADQAGQFQQLMALENKYYQLPAGTELTIVDAKGGEKRLTSDTVLTSGDFAALIARAPAGEPVSMELRDPTAIYALAGHGYLLRDAIYDPEYPDDRPIVNFAEPINKALIDRLLALDVKVVTVTGQASAVGVDLGTVLMVAMIFLALVAALKPILWDPFQAMLDKRQKELAIGAEASRNNQAEEARLAEERSKRNAHLVREIQGKRMARQQETAKQADEIVDIARAEEKARRHSALHEIVQAAGEAETALRAQTPEMAEAIVQAVLGRGDQAAGGKGK